MKDKFFLCSLIALMLAFNIGLFLPMPFSVGVIAFALPVWGVAVTIWVIHEDDKEKDALSNMGKDSI
jgi:hypothetical protein